MIFLLFLYKKIKRPFKKKLLCHERHKDHCFFCEYCNSSTNAGLKTKKHILKLMYTKTPTKH